MSQQPRDDYDNPIPVLQLAPHSGQSISVTDTSARSAELGADTQVVTVHCTCNCFIEVGDSSVTAYTANSHYLPEFATYDISTGSRFGERTTKYLSVVRRTQDGTLFLSERI